MNDNYITFHLWLQANFLFIFGEDDRCSPPEAPQEILKYLLSNQQSNPKESVSFACYSKKIIPLFIDLCKKIFLDPFTLGIKGYQILDINLFPK